MDDEIFKMGIQLLSMAQNKEQVYETWEFMGSSKKDKALIISLDEYHKNIYPNSLTKVINSSDSHFIPYFESDKLFFLDDQLLKEMVNKDGRDVAFPVDYSIMLDTNYSSYIDKFVNSKDFSCFDNNVFSTIDILLREDFCYDYLFYIIENYKNSFHDSGFGKASPRSESIAGYWQNLVSLELFKSIDKKEYCTSGKIKYNISKQEAYLNVDDMFGLFNSRMGKETMDTFLHVHKGLVLFLIGVLRIRFQSQKDYHYKIKELLEYMDSVIGIYFQRETVVAYQYFMNPQNVQLINKVNRQMTKEKLFKNIENFAWDFASPRIMEHFLKLKGRGRYFIPFFLSNDKNLRTLLRMFKVKGVIFDNNAEMLIPIPNKKFLDYFQKNEPDIDIESLANDEALKKRRERYNFNRENNFSCIEEEFSKLAEVMNCK